MARNFKTGVTVTGDAKGAVSAMNLTSKGLGDLNKKAKDTETGFRNFSKSMVNGLGKAAATAAKYGSIAAGAAAAAGAAMIKSGLSSVDALAKTSDKLGVTTEALARMRFAAEQTGVSAGTMDMALQRMTRRVAEAAQGSGEAVNALKELGISAEDLVKKSPDQMFRQITASMGGVENQADKVRLAMKLFDSEGVSLVNTMKGGVTALDQFASEADAAGLSISRIDAAKVEAANDSFNRLRSMFTGLSQQLAVKFAPLLETIADRLFGLGVEAGGSAKAAGKAFSFMTKAAGVFANGIRGIQVGWYGMKLVFQEVYRFIFDKFNWLGQQLTNIWNKLPFVDKVEYTDAINGFLLTMDSEIEESRRRLDELLMRPLPSDSIEDFVDETERAFEASVRSGQNMVREFTLMSDTAHDALKERLLRARESFAKSHTTLNKMVKKAAEENADGVAVAYERGIERMDDGFADFFKTILRDGKVTFDNLKNIFLDTLGEMIYAAARNKIMIGLGFGGGASGALAGVGGSGGAGNALSLASAGKNAYSMITNGWAGVNSMLSNGFQDAAAFFYNRGYESVANSIVGVESGFAQYGGDFGVAGGALLNAGAGFAGSYAGNALAGAFTDKNANSSWGATAGGIAGTVLGAGNPLFTFIGSSIGSALDRLFGSNGNRMGGVALTLGDGTRQNYGKPGHETTKFAMEAGDILEQFASVIGGSNAMIGVSSGRNTGLELSKMIDGEWVKESFKDVEKMMDEAFRWIIKGAKNLATPVRELAVAFDGTGEELAQYTVSLQGLWNLTKNNPVAIVAEQMDLASMTITEAYRGQMATISDMVRDFDGSTSSVQNLSAAMSQNQQMAMQMAVAIRQVSDQIKGMGTGSAQSIRESVMSDDERILSMRSRRDSLRQSLLTLEDPAAVAAATSEAIRLNSQIFQTLGEETRVGKADAFATYAEQIEELAQSRLTMLTKELETSQREQNTEVRNLLIDAAGQQQKAADTMLEAAHVVANAVLQLNLRTGQEAGVY